MNVSVINIFLIIISDSSKITLYRHQDPIMGPRTIPSTENMLQNKEKISDDGVFLIDFDKELVSIKVGNETINVGEQLIYCVEI